MNTLSQLQLRAGATWNVPQDLSRMNTLLPQEMLTTIFSMTLDAATNPYTPRVDKLLRLTWVCTKWRRIILSCPILWAKLSGAEKPEALDACLQRSQKIPITLSRDRTAGPDDFLAHPPILPARMGQLASHLKLIKSIDVRFLVEEWGYIKPLLTQQAPLLECLQISLVSFIEVSQQADSDNDHNGDDYHDDDDSDGDGDDDSDVHDSIDIGYEPPSLSSTLFGGERPPKLKCIELSHCAIPWTSPLLSGLTKLALNSQERPSYDTFLSVLNRLEALESLSLVGDCLPLLEDKLKLSNYKLDAVALHNLRELVLEDDLMVSTLFLITVNCDLHTLVTDCETQDASTDLLQSFFDMCTRRTAKHLSLAPLVELRVRTGLTIDQQTAIGFNGFTALTCDVDPVVHKTETLSLLITVSTVTAPEVEHILATGFDSLPLLQVETIDSDFHPIYFQQLWMSTLPRSIPNVTCISLSPDSLKAFFEAYDRSLADQNAATTLSDIPFVRLEFIGADWELPRTALLDRLLKYVFDHRAQQGYRLERTRRQLPVVEAP